MKLVNTSRAWLLCLLVSGSVLKSTIIVLAGYDQQDSSGLEADDDEDNNKNQEEDDDDDDDEYYSYDPAQEDPLDACRRNPTWKIKNSNGSGSDDSSFYEKCQELTGWKPRDELNRANDYLSMEVKESIGRCIDDRFRAASAAARAAAAAAATEMGDAEDEDEQEQVHIEHAWTLCHESDRTDICAVPATELHGFYTHKRDGDVVTMSDALTEPEAFGIQALHDCMHDILLPHFKDRPFFEERSFGLEPTDEHGNKLYGEDNETGNTVTYMHGLLQIFLPGVASTVYRLVTESYYKANWDKRFDRDECPHPSTLGLRTAEYIHYEHTAYLGHHEDSNSVYTISIALSHPHEYNGGMFHLWSGEAMFKVPRLSAISFLAETMHSVTQVTGGQRNVLVVELWRRSDSPLGMIRPIPVDFDAYVKNQTTTTTQQDTAAATMAVEKTE
jgi:hypothetical protein